MTKDEQIASEAIGYFLKYYNITNDQGQILDFKDHAYMKQIYGDFTPKQAHAKAAQITWSTMANIKSLWLAKNRGMDIIYSLPSASDIKDFVSGKTNRLIDHNSIFQQWTVDKDSIEQKRVGNNVIYFKGTWTERAAIATPADLYISDETDRSKQDIVLQFKTRLQHSNYAWEWYASNPSAPGHGVDKHWMESDQKHWFIKCQHCNEQQFMTMANILYQGSEPFFGCTKCQKELDRHHGQWIRKYQNRDISGYWIPLLLAPRMSAKYILEKKKEYSEEQFANFILGQPFVGKGNVLTRQMFLQNLTSRVNARDVREIIGVDTGIGINYVLTNKYGTFFFDKCDDYGPIRARLQASKNTICVIDQGGDIIGPRKLREEFPGRVFLCFFKASQKNDKLIVWDDDKGTVVADRDRLIQMVVDEFVEKRMPVYGSEAEWYDYMIEWLGMYRTVEENALGIPVFHWNKPSSGRCDYPFAQVYARIGLDRFLESASTFHEPSKDSFASMGLDINPDGTTFLPKQ